MIPDEIMEREDLTWTAKGVFGRLLRLCGEDGRCSVSRPHLATFCGCSLTAIKVAIVLLEDLGLVKNMGHKPGRKTTYLVTWTWADSAPPPGRKTPYPRSDSAPPQGGKRPGSGHKLFDDNDLQAPRGSRRGTKERKTEYCAPTRKPSAKKPAKSKAPKKTRKAREPDPIWDAVVALFYPSLDGAKVPAGTAKMIGKTVTELKARGATPDAIATRKARHENGWRGWPGCACTIHAIVKNWDEVRDDRPDTSRKDDSPARIRTGKYAGVGRSIVADGTRLGPGRVPSEAG